MKEFKVVVAGGRDFYDYELVKKSLDAILTDKRKEFKVIIISGGATGADAMGENYAIDNKLELNIYPAEWGIYGKGAGHIRNLAMANVADAVVVFWDGKSRGTANMISHARRKKLPLRIIKYKHKI